MLSKRRGEEYAERGEDIADGEEDAGEFEAGQYAKIASNGWEYEELNEHAANTVETVYEANTIRLVGAKIRVMNVGKMLRLVECKQN